MSRNQRVGLLAAGAVVVIVAIVVAVASGGGGGNSTSSNSSSTTATSGGGSQTQGTTTAQPTSFKLQIQGGKPAGGVQEFKVKKGDKVTIVVSADAHDVIHLHGYDIEKDIEPGKPATFKFTANIEGIFEIESHVAEAAGREPLMGKLAVEPD
jgi:heme/copper-type cytochrome/quinol oxidase subunit 2